MFQVFWIPIKLFLPGALSQETIVSIHPPRWQMLGENCIPVGREMMVVFDICQCPNGYFFKKGSKLVLIQRVQKIEGQFDNFEETADLHVIFGTFLTGFLAPAANQ